MSRPNIMCPHHPVEGKRRLVCVAARFVACIAAAGLFPNVAMAQQLYLRCEFANFRCSPEIVKIDLQTGVVTFSCAGGAPFTATHRAKISRETIIVPGRDGDFFSVNRVTGDAIIMQRWTGTCRKVEGRVLD